MRVMKIAATFMCVLFPLSVQAQSFDGFLGGLLAGCELEKDFGTFSRSLQDRFLPPGAGAKHVQYPAGLEGAFGPSRSKDGGDYLTIDTPVTGTFRALALASLRHQIGKEDGIYVVEVLFAEPGTKVRATLGAAVKASHAKMNKTYETGATTSLGLKGKTPSLVCNLSN